MKILQINGCHYRRGGADVVYLNTGALLEERGHEVNYFSQSHSNNLDNHDSNYQVEKTDYFSGGIIKRILAVPRFLYSFDAMRKLNKLIDDKNPDIAHIHTYKGSLTASILHVLKRRNIPVVMTLHDYGLLCPHNLFLDGKGRVCTRCVDSNNSFNSVIHRCNRGSLYLSFISWIEYFFHSKFIPFDKYFDKFISVSRFNAEIHVKHLKNSEMVGHIYNFFPNLKAVEVSEAAGGPYVYAGRLSDEKGLITLVEAWALVDRKMVLNIIGEGPVRTQLETLCTELGIKNINFLGFMGKNELYEQLKAASFVIVPSEWYENNPLAIIEAYAHGKPVIASSIGGISEIVEDGRTGFLFVPGSVSQLADKLDHSFKVNSKEYKALSLQAREFAEVNFSADEHYKLLLEFYHEVLAD